MLTLYADIHSDNLLIALTDDSILQQIEEDELATPSARKEVNGYVTCMSRYMLGGAGRLVICDFGQARIGTKHQGHAMPVPYRAPEVILGMEWDETIDCWSLGLMVSNSFGTSLQLILAMSHKTTELTNRCRHGTF